jgi:hypothetical protein
VAGAKAYVYESGTMAAVTVTDSGGTPLAWPVVADLNGTFAQMFYAGSLELKVIVTDPDDAILPGYPVDPVALAQNGAFNASQVVFSPTAEAPSLDVQGGMEDLSAAITALKAVTITGGGLASGGGNLTANRTITVSRASVAEAEAGTANGVVMTPLRTAQAITALAPAAVPLGKAFTSTDQTITSAGLLTLPHGLGAAPEMIQLFLVCQTGEENWTAGDVILASPHNSTSGDNRFNAVYSDATNVYIRFDDNSACFVTGNKTTGATAVLTNGNWRLRVRAWA